MSYNKITVVINTFHSEDKIDRCLNSINPKIKILVIENSNNSNFKLNLEKRYSNVTCYLTGENLGYAKGNNLGLSKVATEYALILNPDAYLENDTLNNLINSSSLKIFAPLAKRSLLKSSSKLKKLGWNSKISLEEGLKKTFEEYKNDLREKNLRT